jgi:hypothetical protein
MSSPATLRTRRTTREGVRPPDFLADNHRAVVTGVIERTLADDHPTLVIAVRRLLADDRQPKG